MKQGIIKKLKETRKKAIALCSKLSGTGIVGFIVYRNDNTGNKAIPADKSIQISKRAS